MGYGQIWGILCKLVFILCFSPSGLGNGGNKNFKLEMTKWL